MLCFEYILNDNNNMNVEAEPEVKARQGLVFYPSA